MKTKGSSSFCVQMWIAFSKGSLPGHGGSRKNFSIDIHCFIGLSFTRTSKPHPRPSLGREKSFIKG
jgi:hypothetical protein